MPCTPSKGNKANKGRTQRTRPAGDVQRNFGVQPLPQSRAHSCSKRMLKQSGSLTAPTHNDFLFALQRVHPLALWILVRSKPSQPKAQGVLGFVESQASRVGLAEGNVAAISRIVLSLETVCVNLRSAICGIVLGNSLHTPNSLRHVKMRTIDQIFLSGTAASLYLPAFPESGVCGKAIQELRRLLYF